LLEPNYIWIDATEFRKKYPFWLLWPFRQLVDLCNLSSYRLLTSSLTLEEIKRAYEQWLNLPPNSETRKTPEDVSKFHNENPNLTTTELLNITRKFFSSVDAEYIDTNISAAELNLLRIRNEYPYNLSKVKLDRNDIGFSDSTSLYFLSEWLKLHKDTNLIAITNDKALTAYLSQIPSISTYESLSGFYFSGHHIARIPQLEKAKHIFLCCGPDARYALQHYQSLFEQTKEKLISILRSKLAVADDVIIVPSMTQYKLGNFDLIDFPEKALAEFWFTFTQQVRFEFCVNIGNASISQTYIANTEFYISGWARQNLEKLGYGHTLSSNYSVAPAWRLDRIAEVRLLGLEDKPN